MKRNSPELFLIAALLGICLAQGAVGAPRPAWTTSRVSGSPNPPAPYNVERIYPRHTFTNPVDLAFLPGSRRLFVAEQSGRLSSFETLSNAAPAQLALNLRQHHKPFDNILGFAFHPGFATNRFIFINYNEPGGRENGAHVSRFTFSSLNPPIIDPASEQIFIRWLSGGHNGCTLAFGNDGFLYISAGDGDDPDPPDGKRKTGQDLSDLLACIFRIDVDHPKAGRPYAIPRDNPFLQTPGARPEIWAFGFRNPFRMSFDRPTGDLWVGDVGWEQWEMIDRVQRGGNYGWSLVEGPNPHVRTDTKPGPGPILPPLIALPHSDAASITGGYVYHGMKLGRLNGAYLYGDWETGKFWALRQKEGRLLSNEELCDTALKPVAFTLDPDGELIVLDYNGGLYQFVPNTAPPANQSFPRKLSDTGLFGTLQPLTPASGTIPYRIAAPMWNDHATAEWLLGVPGTAAIATAGGVGNIAGNTWFFPSNTVLARTVTLEMTSGDPSSARRIETQLLHWDGQAWNPYSYRWRDNQNDADLVGNEGLNTTYTVLDADAPGGRRETPWRFMSRAECLRCHNAWAGEALTLNWLQLGSPGAESSELQRLTELAVLKVKGATPTSETLAYPYDDSFPLAERARSWLHVNCGTCHRFGAGGTVAVHLNADKPLKELRALDERPGRGDFGLVGARIVASSDPDSSTLLYRVNTEGAGHMPYIGPRLVDLEGARLLREWIRSLPARSDNDPGRAAAKKLAEENASRLARWAASGDAESIGALLSTMNGSLALLDRLEGAASQNARTTAAVAAAQRHTNAFVRDLFQRFVPPDERRRTLGSDLQPKIILELPGDASRGKAIFAGASQCMQCHGVVDGRAFGPVLTGLSRKYRRDQLLEQILQPSKVVAPEFRTTTLILQDGSERSGLVVKRTAEEVSLRDATRTDQVIKLTDVKESRESQLSAMPEGLLAPLTAQEAADLLEYLMGL